MENTDRSEHPKTPKDTEQAARDRQEKSRHPPEENALESTQDKNPVPPESSRE